MNKHFTLKSQVIQELSDIHESYHGLKNHLPSLPCGPSFPWLREFPEDPKNGKTYPTGESVSRKMRT